MKFGPKETKELNQYLRTGRNRNRQFLTTQLVDDLEPGSLKDELLKDFDPSQETYEEYLQRKSLERPFNMADGGRIAAKRGVLATGDRRMYAGRMMTEDQISALKERRKVPKKEGMVFDKETKKFRPKKKAKLIPGMSEKSIEAKAAKTSEKLKSFVTKFLEKNKRPPTIMEIADGTKSSTASVKKYLEEGTDFIKTSLTDVGAKGAKQSALSRANPLGPDASQKKRYQTLKESLKFASEQDKADIKGINAGKKVINKFFKNSPDLINTTEFGKNIKAMMSLRMDIDTGNFFSKL